MSIIPELTPIQLTDKGVLRNLMSLYLYDMSAFNGEDVNVHGRYDYQYLDHYWTEGGRYPFFINVNGQLAGFALVREICQKDQLVYSMAEFFVMRKYRGKGVAKQSAFTLFARFKGEWHVAQEAENIPAQLFWRHVIKEYTQGNMRESQDMLQDGPSQRFSTRN